MRLHPTSYRWVRENQKPIPPGLLSLQELVAASLLEAVYLKEHGRFPAGFIVKVNGDVAILPTHHMLLV